MFHRTFQSLGGGGDQVNREFSLTQIFTQVSNFRLLQCSSAWYHSSGWNIFLSRLSGAKLSRLEKILWEEKKFSASTSSRWNFHWIAEAKKKKRRRARLELKSLFIPIMAYSFRESCDVVSQERKSSKTQVLQVLDSLFSKANSSTLDILNVECIISLILSCSFFFTLSHTGERKQTCSNSRWSRFLLGEAMFSVSGMKVYEKCEVFI